MSLARRLKEALGERLSPSLKLSLKTLFVGSVAAVMGGAARVRNLAARVRLSAETHGLDSRRAWDVPARAQAPPARPWGAADFLFFAGALSKQKLDPARPVRASIIIPVFNKVEYTFQCLRSLVREVDFTQTEVIVVDNASTDETPAVLEHFGGLVRVVRNETNLGFVDACNLGAREARGEYLVFLNNDTVVLPGWLENLVDTVEEDARAGAVGSMFLYPDGRIQEAGAVVWNNGEAFHYGWGKSPDDRRFGFAREADYCSGASLLIRKELFEKLGGFDRRYAPAYYEDADLCFGVRSLGYKVVYQPLSRLVHEEGATAGADTRSGFKRYQVTNRAKFAEKWREVLAREHFAPDPSKAFRAANRLRGPFVLVCDDRTPAPDRDAGSARMAFILSSLAEWAAPVFVSLSKEARPEYERQLWKQGIETARPVDVRRLLRERKFHSAVLCRPSVAEALLKKIRRADRGVKIVFDMVDAHFIRLGREVELTGDARTAREAARYKKIEPALARASDHVWCTSSDEQELMRQLAPRVESVIVPTVHSLQGRGRPFREREHLLFLGNFLHRPNEDAVRYLLEEILPLVRAEIPGVRLLVVGDNAPPDLVPLSAQEPELVRVLGHVPDLAPVMSSARVFVAPIRFGAGVKGKIGEALSRGLPVVTTNVGAEGMGFRDGEHALIADDPRDFAAAVVRLYRDPSLWQKLSDAGHRHVEQHFTPPVIGRRINDSIRGLSGQTKLTTEAQRHG